MRSTSLPGRCMPRSQCPVFGGKPKSVDAAKVRGMRGVIKVVTLDDAVAGGGQLVARATGAESAR